MSKWDITGEAADRLIAMWVDRAPGGRYYWHPELPAPSRFRVAYRLAASNEIFHVGWMTDEVTVQQWIKNANSLWADSGAGVFWMETEHIR